MDDYRISVVSQLILGVSYRIVLAAVVSGKTDITCNAGSAAVKGSHYTGRSKGIRAPSPAVRALFDGP